jgi:hypothetical protein
VLPAPRVEPPRQINHKLRGFGGQNFVRLLPAKARDLNARQLVGMSRYLPPTLLLFAHGEEGFMPSDSSK